jgi:hypothetical protein
MATGGITYGSARAILATVVENGISADDPRVKNRTDEAQKEILDSTLPVNSCMTADVVASGTTLLLPKEMENAMFVEVLGNAPVNGQTDVSNGWYNIVNQFAYVDPSMAHDLPLVDQFLQPDPGDNTILRRQYDFPGLAPNSTVRVTGAKRWLPIENDSTFLIVQNVPAIKEMIQAIEYAENNDPQNADLFRKRCLERLQSEVKKHQLDPINSVKRKAAYEADMVNYSKDTFGWTRARLAFELPEGLSMGKSELSRILEQAEMRLMDKGQWVGTLQEYEAQVTGGHILAPREVETIISVSLCGRPIDLKSIFFRYHKSGHRFHSSTPELRDEGEITDSEGYRRKQYRLNSDDTKANTIKFVAKLRWLKKQPSDYMIVRNFEAIRMMCMAILFQKAEKWQDAGLSEQMSIQEVDKQLSEYLSGQAIISPVDFNFGGRPHGVL